MGRVKSLVFSQTKEGFFCKILFDFVLDGNAFAANLEATMDREIFSSFFVPPRPEVRNDAFCLLTF